MVCRSQTPSLAAEAVEEKGDLAARVEDSFLAARQRFRSETNSAEAAWHFARACFDRAEYAKENAGRAEVAQQGIAACRQLLAREPHLAAAHYYLGMTLGQLARTKKLTALKIVEEMERAFERARQLDEHLDCAGPDRNLGLLYLEAPAWPVSIGNRVKARQHLQRAVNLAPHYPENRLNLAEAYARWGEPHNLQRELKALEGLWQKARKDFAGEHWEASWLDWPPRFAQLKRKAAKMLEESRANQPRDTSP